MPVSQRPELRSDLTGGVLPGDPFETSRAPTEGMEQTLRVVDIVAHLQALDARVASCDGMVPVRTDRDDPVALDLQLESTEGLAGADLAAGSQHRHGLNLSLEY
jgi:hypothetical protein